MNENNTAPFVCDAQTATVAARLGRETAAPIALEDGLLFAVHHGDEVRLLSTPGFDDSRAAKPERFCRQVVVLDVESFVDHLARSTDDVAEVVGRNSAFGPGRLEVWANESTQTLTAYVDGVDGWREHKTTLTLRLSPEWKEWAGIDGKLLAQSEFAQFIEDHLSTISDPDGAVLLDICQTLEAHTNVAFKMQSILANGQRQFRWEETVEAKAGQKGDLLIPAELRLVLRPFVGSEAVVVTARFRYRIRDGVLTLGVRLAEPTLALERAFAGVVDAVQASVPVRVNNGIA